jgi:hypothetical protein
MIHFDSIVKTMVLCQERRGRKGRRKKEEGRRKKLTISDEQLTMNLNSRRKF